MTDPQCKDCRFWEDQPKRDFGTCYRNPPQVVLLENLATRWPSTGQDDWCGEFQAKPPEYSYVPGPDAKPYDICAAPNCGRPRHRHTGVRHPFTEPA